MNIFFRNKRIYADWAATSPLHREVKDAMTAARRIPANPSSIYKEGVEARKALQEYREVCARTISVKSDEIIFTSGGTESNNTIIHGVINTCLSSGAKPKDIHIVSTSIEHSSILEPLRMYMSRGIDVTFVNPDEDGIIKAEKVLAAIKPNTVLVSCMYANNEIGTIQPISKIGSGIRKIRADRFREGEESDYPVFHVDACQAPLWLVCDMEGLRADAMTLDGHKMQGPKGVGALALRNGIEITPLLLGGGQEHGQRGTTESIELIAGFTKALQLAQKSREERSSQAIIMRNRFISLIKKHIPDALINGSVERRLANNINISIPHLSDPEFAVIELDQKGIACSTKSSCLKGEESSYVVESILGESGESESWRARNTLRFTIDPDITDIEIGSIINALKTLS